MLSESAFGWNGKLLIALQAERYQIPFCLKTRVFPRHGTIDGLRFIFQLPMKKATEKKPKFFGYIPKSNEAAAVVTAEQLPEYIRTRRPCILRQHSDSSLNSKRILEELRNVECSVAVEKRDLLHPSFGAGHKANLSFQQFLSLLSQGNESFYMTTQDIPDFSEDDRSSPFAGLPRAVAAEPASTLLKSGALPLIPDLAKCSGSHLITNQINFWIGRSAEGSSTGLHHDHHDNFYMLLQGKKRFTLFPPSEIDHESLQTYGYISQTPTVFPNGLISYIVGLRSDGADLSLVDRLHLHQLKLKVGELSHKCSELRQDSNHPDLAHFEEQLALAEDKWQEAELAVMESSRKRRPTKAQPKSVKRRRLNNPTMSSQSTVEEESKHPLNFCRLSSSLRREIPPCITASLEAGDVLYLPASWFHEVCLEMNAATDGIMRDAQIDNSHGDLQVVSQSTENEHIALNYWFAPPALTSESSATDALYPDEYWAEWLRLVSINPI